MTSIPRSAFKALQQPVLDCASLLVPASRRHDWRLEWRAELWHVRQASIVAGEASWQAERDVACFCLGAFPDAFFLRWEFRTGFKPLKPLRGSPAKCLLFLIAMLAFLYLISIVVPGVRIARSLAWNYAYSSVVLIRNADAKNDATASISPSQFQKWSAGKSKFFNGFAFFRVAEHPVALESSKSKGWKIAYATPNLFSLLGVPLQFSSQSASADNSLRDIVLSDRLWRKDFHADPGVVGTVLHIRGRGFRIAAVAPRGSWRLPVKVDAWLLEPDSAVQAGSQGYVVAHLSSVGRAEMWAPRVLIKTNGPHQSELDLMGVSLDEKAPPPWAVFVLGMLLALLALPATASVSMSEYGLILHKLTWPKRVRRWTFLGSKFTLLLSIAYFGSLDLAYAFTTLFSPASVYLHLASSFLICLAGLSWACRDQRQRCPLCLRRVTHPAQVGAASQTFLGWSGTELICAGGHTLLHIPALPTSWFGAQRWLLLDASWDFLFAG
jgi:hypothetical protein